MQRLLRQVNTPFALTDMLGSPNMHKGDSMKPFQHPVVIFTLAVLGAPGALAGPTFEDRDLRGEYVFAGIELHRPPSGVGAPEHCAFAGTASFDGQGRAMLSGTRRCVLGSNPVSTVAFEVQQYYLVAPDGSFVMSELQDLSDPAHGQIVDHGRSLLLDGTLRTSPTLVNWLATAMRR